MVAILNPNNINLGNIVDSILQIIISFIITIKDMILGIFPAINQNIIIIALSFIIVWSITEIDKKWIIRTILTILLFIMLKTIGG